MKQEKGTLKLPKFKIDFDTSMSDVLISLGMNEAFSNFANFSGIIKEKDIKIKIDDVIHKTFLSVDENGTTAAAVTAVLMVCTGIRRYEEKEFYMNVNRPFLFFLRNNKFPKNHQMLFMSKIEFFEEKMLKDDSLECKGSGSD